MCGGGGGSIMKKDGDARTLSLKTYEKTRMCVNICYVFKKSKDGTEHKQAGSHRYGDSESKGGWVGGAHVQMCSNMFRLSLIFTYLVTHYHKIDFLTFAFQSLSTMDLFKDADVEFFFVSILRSFFLFHTVL